METCPKLTTGDHMVLFTNSVAYWPTPAAQNPQRVQRRIGSHVSLPDQQKTLEDEHAEKNGHLVFSHNLKSTTLS